MKQKKLVKFNDWGLEYIKIGDEFRKVINMRRHNPKLKRNTQKEKKERKNCHFFKTAERA